MSGPTVPRGLRTEGRALWRATLGTYDLDDLELVQLRAACEAADRCAEAKAAVDKDGAIVDGRYGPRAHPGVAIEREARAAMLNALKLLGREPVTNQQRTAAARAARYGRVA
jgi:phage terminase small subunit